MNYIKLALIGLVLGSTASIADDCTAPPSPAAELDGTTASLEEMLEAIKPVNAFKVANTDYRACLDPLINAAEVAAAGDSPGPDLEATLAQLNGDYNASVSAETDVASAFNVAYRAFCGRDHPMVMSVDGGNTECPVGSTKACGGNCLLLATP